MTAAGSLARFLEQHMFHGTEERRVRRQMERQMFHTSGEAGSGPIPRANLRRMEHVLFLLSMGIGVGPVR